MRQHFTVGCHSPRMVSAVTYSPGGTHVRSAYETLTAVGAAVVTLAAGAVGAAPAVAAAPVPTVVVHVSGKAVTLSTGHRVHAGRTLFKVVTRKGDHTLQIARLRNGYTLAQAGSDLGKAFSGDVKAINRVDRNIVFRGGAEARPNKPGMVRGDPATRPVRLHRPEQQRVHDGEGLRQDPAAAGAAEPRADHRLHLRLRQHACDDPAQGLLPVHEQGRPAALRRVPAREAEHDRRPDQALLQARRRRGNRRSRCAAATGPAC